MRKKTSGEKEQRAEYNVTAEEFVRAWQTSASADEVAQRLKMPKPIAHARATSYRKAGVNLKSMPRGKMRRGLDVAGLNGIVQELSCETPPKREMGTARKVVSRVMERAR